MDQWLPSKSGSIGLFEFGTGFDWGTGRFTISVASVYTCLAHAIVQGCMRSTVVAAISVSAMPDASQLSLTTMDCSKQSTGTMPLAATSNLQADDFVSLSILIQSQTECNVTLTEASWFTASVVDTELGFSAVSNQTQPILRASWHELNAWDTSAVGCFDLDAHFDLSRGRYQPLLESPTLFYAIAQISLDEISTAAYRVAIVVNGVVNGETDSHFDLRITRGFSRNPVVSAVEMFLVDPGDLVLYFCEAIIWWWF